jgi:hypothetical protein
MAHLKDSSAWLSCNLFSIPVDVKMHEILEFGVKLYNQDPEIEQAILKDQDNYGKKRRVLRDDEKAWIRSMTGDFPELSGSTARNKDFAARPLETGRSRMLPEVIFIFLVLRGYWGSVTDGDSCERLTDSITLHHFLDSHGFHFPCRSTLHENLNKISNSTYELIIDAQTRMILDEELDDFGKLTIDSTAVKGNCCWPTDSGSILALTTRMYRTLLRLTSYGLPDPANKLIDRWLTQLKKLDFELNIACGKPHSSGKVKKLNRRISGIGDKLYDLLAKKSIMQKQAYCASEHSPLKRHKIETLFRQFAHDNSTCLAVWYHLMDRLDGQKTAPEFIVASINDDDASFIIKGGRETVVGYRPQVIRSANGFIPYLFVPEGNAADSGQFRNCVEKAVERTGILPELVIADDGYPSAEGKKRIESNGFTKVVFSGSKGKRLTPEKDWDSELFIKARNDRSAVESIIFNLKYSYDLGRMRRRGLTAVRAEMLEKVIAFNFARMALITSRKQHDEAMKESA